MLDVDKLSLRVADVEVLFSLTTPQKAKQASESLLSCRMFYLLSFCTLAQMLENAIINLKEKYF